MKQNWDRENQPPDSVGSVLPVRALNAAQHAGLILWTACQGVVCA